MEEKKTSESGGEPGYTPASPVKRAMAWIGLVYMIILVGLTTYYYFTGTPLQNLGPLLAVPGLAGLGIVGLISWRTTGRPGKWGAVLLAALCWLAALASLPIGIAGLMSNFSAMVFPGG